MSSLLIPEALSVIIISESERSIAEFKSIEISSFSLSVFKIHESIEFAINSLTACQFVKFVDPTFLKKSVCSNCKY